MKKRSTLKELLAALTGALITSVIQLLFLLRTSAPTNWKGSDWVSFGLAAITGAIIGWAYRLATGLQRLTEDAIVRLEAASHSLEFQDEPLKMLISTKKHAETLGLLLSDSLKEKYRFISYVDENKYLGYLSAALSATKKYEGVQRQPVRWFRDNSSGVTERYLHDLRDHRMKERVRIFILEDEQEELMKEDLANAELMQFYWEHTGDVETYWITTTQLTKFYPAIRSIPKDFGLYDEELLIEYDSPTLTLFFDILQPDSRRRDLFRWLADQKKNNTDRPFIKIERPTA
jgi:hypothetical protein